MKLLPIALVLAGTTGLAGLAFAAGGTGTVRDPVSLRPAVSTDDLSSLRLADFQAGEDDDEDSEYEDDDEGEDEGDEDDGYVAGAAEVCVTGLVSGDDDDDEDGGAIVCDPAAQNVTDPAAVAPDPNRAPIFNSAPTAVVN